MGSTGHGAGNDVRGRFLSWPGCRNARDLGGLPRPGGLTRRGQYLRSDTLTRLTDDGLQSVLAAGVTAVVDLRNPPLLRREPSPFASVRSPRLVQIPIVPADFPFPVAFEGGYERLLDEAMPQMPSILAALAGSPGAVVFHCHSGTGRTGALAVLLLDLAGVDADAIQGDYLLSFDNEGAPGEKASATEVVPRLLQHLRHAYGGSDRYLALAGVPRLDRERIAGRLSGDG